MSKASIYYFKKDKNTFVLHKNKHKVFSINTLYTKLIQIKNNKIYFLSSTKLGSGLFVYDNGVVSQLNKADNIADAKIIDENNAYITAVTSSGYISGIVKLSKLNKKISFSINKDLKDRNYFQFDDNYSNVSLDQS